jgi:hypothetical protein
LIIDYLVSKINQSVCFETIETFFHDVEPVGTGHSSFVRLHLVVNEDGRLAVKWPNDFQMLRDDAVIKVFILAAPTPERIGQSVDPSEIIRRYGSHGPEKALANRPANIRFQLN